MESQSTGAYPECFIEGQHFFERQSTCARGSKLGGRFDKCSYVLVNHLVDGSTSVPVFLSITWWTVRQVFLCSCQSPGGRFDKCSCVLVNHLVDGSTSVPVFLSITWWTVRQVFLCSCQSPGGRFDKCSCVLVNHLVDGSTNVPLYLENWMKWGLGTTEKGMKISYEVSYCRQKGLQ